MKQKLSLLLLALFTTVGAWAQVVTDYASAGTPVTYSDYVASAGTGARYAFMMPSDNAATLHKWVGFNSTVGNDNTLTVDRLFVLENSNTASKYWLKRYSNGEYLAGNNSFSNTPLDLTLANRMAGDYATEYSESNLHISFDDANGGHFNNGNGSYNFASGTGGWSTCIAYGPYYIVDVNCYEYGTSTPVQESVQYIVKDGTTINAPQVVGYTSNNESVTVNGADAVLNCYYNPIVFDPNDVAGTTFTLKCARGYVYWNGTAMKGNASNATKFAIVSYDNNTYLYDATNNAFVCHTTAAKAGLSGNPALESSTDFSKAVKNISFGSTNIAAYPYYVQEDQFGNWLNMDGTPNVYFNTWKDYEGGTGGNTYEIKVADTDFDQTDAVAMLDDYFNGPTAFANAIAQLEKYPYGTGLNHYSLVVENNDYTTQATTIISNLKEQGYSKGNLSTAQMLLDGTSINIPTTGAFYRFKSNATSKYIGFAESGKQPMVNAENACIYFYTASKQFLSYNKGRYLSGGTGNPAATIGTGGAAFNFYESNYSSKTFGTYRIRVADDSYGSLIDWIDDYLNGWGAGDNARCEWTIEAVDELPITMNVVNNKYYGTINLPVAVTIPEGVYAYKAAVAGDVMTLTKVVENGVRVLAANTPVVLYSASEVTSLAISAEAGTGADDDAFSGTTAAITAPEGTNYVLSYSPTEGVGFYKYTGSVIPGFKAYFNDPSGSSVKGFSFSMEDVETAIRAIESENNGIEIYDIAGRRVPQAQKGLYIVNGKKVMFK